LSNAQASAQAFEQTGRSIRMRRLLLIAIVGVLVASTVAPAAAESDSSIRLFGNGVDDIDRVKIRIDEPGAAGGPPADIGATDITIEFWVKGTIQENQSGQISCSGNNWINGNIVVDRDRFNQQQAYGVSFGAGYLAFGIDGESSATACSSSVVLDGEWHHIALQRRISDGWMWIYVDGFQEAEIHGPHGDISYPDDGVPGNFCGGPCDNSDPFIVIGAEKHDAGSAYPSFSGWFDELRLSTTLRYSADFIPQSSPFATDAMTAALYHFDEGSGTVAGDSSGAPGGPSNGELKVGGNPVGPLWSSDTPFTQSSGPFNDVAGSTFEAEILWLFDQGITTGCTTSSYCPDDPVTRAQMATFLTRALDLDAVSGDTFSDDNGSVHEPNVEALAASGITLGCADGLFCPDDSVSRGQMASFLVRGIDGLDPATQDYFTDDDGTVHETNINVVAENGITLGCGEALYCPADPVTRGQMAAFLFRALN